MEKEESPLKGKEIGEFQLKKGLSTYKLCKKLKVSHSTLQKIIKTNDKPSEDLERKFRELEKEMQDVEPMPILDRDGRTMEVDARVEFLSDGKAIDKPGYYHLPTTKIVVGFDINPEILETHTPVLSLDKDLLLENEIYVVAIIEFAGHLAAILYNNAQPHRYAYKDIIGKIRFIENVPVKVVEKKMER